MLLQRILTAVPLAIGMIWLILYQPTSVFAYLLYMVALIAAFEWSFMAGLTSLGFRLLFAASTTALTWFLIEYLHNYIILAVYLSVLFWVGVYVFLKKIIPVPRGSVFSLFKLLSALIVIPAAVCAMYLIHQLDNGPQWLLYGLALVWVADIGAYFSGRKFGRTKLAEKISPGKTKEGLWGALAATSLYSLGAAYYFGVDGLNVILLLLLSLLLTVISVTGDLYESYLKRECGIKDSGRILPGHGGILDRIDSVLAAMPFFVVGYHWVLFPVAGLSL